MGIAVFSSLGLPGLNGFVGEFLIFKGAFRSRDLGRRPLCLGLLVTAVFLLTYPAARFHGPLNAQRSGFADLTIG